MLQQYCAVGIQSSVWNCYKRSEYKRNLEYVAASIRKAVSRSSVELPVKLVAISEGALGGWAPFGGENHLKYYKELAPEIPGEETEFLGKLCKELNIYLVGQMQAKDESIIKDRVFNMGFVINPEGEVILKHYKTAVFPREPVVTPQDIWNVYLEKCGSDPVKLFEALYPVVKTEIGNIGICICAEGSYPETARGLALNGAEIIYRPQYIEPFIGNGMFEIQNRSHAIFNTCYVIAPQIADHYGSHLDGAGTVPAEQKSSYGKSQIIGYRGNILSEVQTGDTWVSAVINIDGLRDYRTKALWTNFTKDLKIEEYKVIYEAMKAKGGLYPVNLHMSQPPLSDEAELCRYQVNKAVEMGIYTPPQDWKPYTIEKETLDRLEKARNITQDV